MPSDPEKAIQYLRALMEGKHDLDPDDIVDALGAVWLTHPTTLSKEAIADLCAALRRDFKAAKEDREGEEWKGDFDAE